VRLTRARHETVNERLKKFSSIRNIFRHNLNLHWYVLHAVVKLTTLMLDTADHCSVWRMITKLVRINWNGSDFDLFDTV